MNRTVVKSRVSSAGILHLSLPMGIEAANKEVQGGKEVKTVCAPKIVLTHFGSHFGSILARRVMHDVPRTSPIEVLAKQNSQPPLAVCCAPGYADRTGNRVTG